MLSFQAVLYNSQEFVLCKIVDALIGRHRGRIVGTAGDSVLAEFASVVDAVQRNTALTYRGKATNVQEVEKELGVRYVLEGSVQKAADQARIVAQLIDTTTGGHLWSARYDRPLQDIFTLQDKIVQKIVTTLKLQLSLRQRNKPSPSVTPLAALRRAGLK